LKHAVYEIKKKDAGWIFAFALQKWLHESATILRYAYIAYLVKPLRCFCHC